MENFLKKRLGYSEVVRSGRGGGGCISQGEVYLTDRGSIYVKENARPGSREMFEGEMASLERMRATGTVRVPRGVAVLERPTGPGYLLVMEYLHLRRCSNQAQLGRDLASLHLHNTTASPHTHHRFGFDVETCCGFLPQGNGWTDNWVTFYTEKLEEQINRQSDPELHNLWSTLRDGISSFFTNIEVYPSLLHGDLWSGNVGQVDNTPVVFDPASFYGHHEYDLAIGKMFGGFGAEFHESYHAQIPKQDGFETRSELYQLFHYLNHWNHFGDGYKARSLSIMKKLNKRLK